MEEVANPAEPQTAPAQAFPAQAQPQPAGFTQVELERAEIDRDLVSQEPGATSSKSNTHLVFLGDWESSNSRLSIRENGIAVSDFFKDREKEVFSHTAESTWKENGTANQIIIHRAKDPDNFSTFTMDSSENSFSSINSKGVKNHYSRSAKVSK
jgi:hypothetical protein